MGICLRSQCDLFQARRDDLGALRARLITQSSVADRWGVHPSNVGGYYRSVPFDRNGQPIHPLGRSNPESATVHEQISYRQALDVIESQFVREGGVIRIPSFANSVHITADLHQAPLVVRRAVEKVTLMRSIGTDAPCSCAACSAQGSLEGELLSERGILKCLEIDQAKRDWRVQNPDLPAYIYYAQFFRVCGQPALTLSEDEALQIYDDMASALPIIGSIIAAFGRRQAEAVRSFRQAFDNGLFDSEKFVEAYPSRSAYRRQRLEDCRSGGCAKGDDCIATLEGDKLMDFLHHFDHITCILNGGEKDGSPACMNNERFLREYAKKLLQLLCIFCHAQKTFEEARLRREQRVQDAIASGAAFPPIMGRSVVDPLVNAVKRRRLRGCIACGRPVVANKEYLHDLHHVGDSTGIAVDLNGRLVLVVPPKKPHENVSRVNELSGRLLRTHGMERAIRCAVLQQLRGVDACKGCHHLVTHFIDFSTLGGGFEGKCDSMGVYFFSLPIHCAH